MKPKKYLSGFFILLLLLTAAGASTAAVKSGYHCSDCHTMHNSQDGRPVATELNTSTYTFETDATPNQFLLVSDCTGCHTSSSGSSTIVKDTPIVFNTITPVDPLAGGNYYYVRSDDSRGHNPAGITSRDSVLGLTPPGGNTMAAQLRCAGQYGCHGDRSTGSDYTALKGAHHADDSGGVDGSSVGLSYRFLNGVVGKEDPDWEQDNINTSHNEYKGSTGPSADTISYLCSRCHGDFHTWTGGVSAVGTASPWLRHPTDITLKASGEYANYTTYSMTAPVARPDPGNVPDTTRVRPGTDIVMCLSCHRAHASPYYKILRWDYKSPTLSTALSGCNVCHTSKN